MEEIFRKVKALAKSHAHLVGEHPDLRRQIDDGLLVALSGGVVLDSNTWRVKTPHPYRVRLDGAPTRWHCSCPQGANYGPVTGDFFGHPGRVCKHVVAVAVCLMAGTFLPRPDNLMALIERVCWAEAGGQGEPVRELPNANGVKLVRVEKGGVSLCLKLGRIQSGDLAWGAPVEEQDGRAWCLDGQAWEKYKEWVSTISESNGGK